MDTVQPTTGSPADSAQVLIRKYGDLDAAATLEVLRRAIRVTASRDYAPEQIAAWAPADTSITAWDTRRAAARIVVATLGARCGPDQFSDAALTGARRDRRDVGWQP